jgi:formylglycine-generating enzyme required for sulfatase activity
MIVVFSVACCFSSTFAAIRRCWSFARFRSVVETRSETAAGGSIIKLFVLNTFFALIFSSATAVRADTFGTGSNTFAIEFITIGNAGNPADATGNPNPAGSVPYHYRIGKYEISGNDIDNANAAGGLGITHNASGTDKPAAEVTWFEAASFVNWLNTSKGHLPAYKFNGADFELWQPGDPGYDAANPYRNRFAFYFLPNTDEWYKAAYYDPTSGVYYDYPTGSNVVPAAVTNGTSPGTAVYFIGQSGPADVMAAGGLSPYGTMAQGGNVSEWEETEFDLMNDSVSSDRGHRGSSWNSGSARLAADSRLAISPSFSGNSEGFRVASVVPEPGTMMLAVLGLAACCLVRQRAD